MAFEGLICPSCSGSLNEVELTKKLVCPQCKIDFRHKKFLGFLEYLMMQGIVADIDFFDKSIYGDEIRHSTETEKELKDETNPDEFEDNRDKIEYMDVNDDLGEVTTDEQEFRTWDGIDEDWIDFNEKDEKDKDKKK